MTEPTVRDHPRFRVIPRQSDKLAIFFSGSSAADHHFHWWNIANRIEASVILINNGENEWYQQGVPGLGDSIESMTETLRAWRDSMGSKRVYTCGASMGGTAALMFGVPLEASVLGLGFEPRLDYPFGQVQRIMVKACPKIQSDLRPLAHASQRPIHVYAGENEPVDIKGAAEIIDGPSVSVTTLRRVGHDPAVQMRRAGDLDPIVDAFLADATLPTIRNPGRACKIKNFPDAIYEAYCASKLKDWPKSEQYARQAVRLYPNSEMANFLLGQAIFYNERPGAALPFFSTALALDPEMDQAEFLLGASLRRLGDYKDSIRVHRRRIARNPQAHTSHFEIGMIYQTIGNPDAARREIVIAADLEPRKQSYRDRLEKLKNTT